MQEIIKIQNLSYTYLPKTPYKKNALKDINISVGQGDCLGIIGSNGSGKTTLIQHLNGILYPSKGRVEIYGEDTRSDELRDNLWQKVGLVMQYPEQQVFEATVFDDVAYGPKNLGLNTEAIKARVNDSLLQVGLKPEEVTALPTANLSGGTRRRVAIAGVLAIKPQILILDEPTAGLDPRGKAAILQVIGKLQREEEVTVIVISHSLKDILPITNKIALLDKGEVIFYGNTSEVVTSEIFTGQYEFILPDYVKLVNALAKVGICIQADLSDQAEVESEIFRLVKERHNE